MGSSANRLLPEEWLIVAPAGESAYIGFLGETKVTAIIFVGCLTYTSATLFLNLLLYRFSA